MEEIITEEYKEYSRGFGIGMNETIDAFNHGGTIAIPDIEDETDDEYYWYYMGRQDSVYYFFNLLKENEGNINILATRTRDYLPNLIIESFVKRVQKTNEKYGTIFPISQFIIQKKYL